MNRRAIGIFTAAITAVMLIAATNFTSIIQQRQAYAASPASSLKDNLRANLGNRNQHLNQQRNCVRTDGCANSDIIQGTLGNDNSVTGFADQSTTNTTTTANAATSGPAGSKGELGPPGPVGAKGDTGPQGSLGPVQIFKSVKVENTITLTAGEPGKSGTVSAVCPSGTELTGGAYRKSPDVIIFTSAPTSDNTAWEVSGVNGNTSIDVFITSVAECGKLVS